MINNSMSKNSERVKRWRKTTKARMVQSLGGKCCICNYDNCDESLDIHHLDPTKKEFGFGGVRSNIKGWDKLVIELRKCVLLCKNCHAEVHSTNIDTVVPNDAPRFNEEYNDYKLLQPEGTFNKCPICNNDKLVKQRVCSHTCAAKLPKFEWDKVDLHELLHIYKTFTAVGEHLGVSNGAVSKRYKKINS